MVAFAAPCGGSWPEVWPDQATENGAVPPAKSACKLPSELPKQRAFVADKSSGPKPTQPTEPIENEQVVLHPFASVSVMV